VVHCAKTAEPNDMPFWMKTGGPKEVQSPQVEGAISGGCPGHSNVLALFAATSL